MSQQSGSSSRQLLLIFGGVAVVSAAVLVWLGILLLQQDARLAAEWQQERLEQAAERVVSVVEQRIAGVETQLALSSRQTAKLPEGVSLVEISAGSLTAIPAQSLPWIPVRPADNPEATGFFADVERLEFARSDLEGAARAYTTLAHRSTADLRAGALARLARVERKLGRPVEALSTYSELARDEGHVDGLPARLVASVGRGTVLKASGRDADLKMEAEALVSELDTFHWRLLRSEFDYYRELARSWGAAPHDPSQDARARAEAGDWLWQNRMSLPSSGRRTLDAASASTFLVWQANDQQLRAAIVGPAFLLTLCDSATKEGLACALMDPGGRLVVGSPSTQRPVAVRTPIGDGLPWSVQVSGTPSTAAPPQSSRRRLLILSFAVVALVLSAGWYFIFSALRRERRLATLQSDFVAAVSHEFRSPITSMSQIAEMLSDGRLHSDDDKRRSFDILLREADRLRRLVEGLLDFSRFESGRVSLHLAHSNITALARATVADFQSRVGSDGYRGELDAPPTDIVALADADALTRALWNLLDNAVKYSPECRTVWVELAQCGSDIAITVRDSGIGIPAGEQREIFDRFVRGMEPQSRRIKGTGIGLATVRDILSAHGGRVDVWSEAGRGSRFTLVLPAAVSGS